MLLQGSRRAWLEEEREGEEVSGSKALVPSAWLWH